MAAHSGAHTGPLDRERCASASPPQSMRSAARGAPFRRLRQILLQKRRNAVNWVDAKVPASVDDSVGRKWCPTSVAWVSAVCAGVVAVLSYMNSLDADFRARRHGGGGGDPTPMSPVTTDHTRCRHGRRFGSTSSGGDRSMVDRRSHMSYLTPHSAQFQLKVSTVRDRYDSWLLGSAIGRPKKSFIQSDDDDACRLLSPVTSGFPITATISSCMKSPSTHAGTAPAHMTGIHAAPVKHYFRPTP
ncbi:hypothetical protein HPB49_023219 [Dermacentor silvarum]|uniref:Uncharacterized protein n=1 Tax=Dermacentor silvarum TaxID=543639 RepID=A0ACB8DLG3_DERSI|nr:hypothetical protein HPB49_023219 [Dermacentor silvarum]